MKRTQLIIVLLIGLIFTSCQTEKKEGKLFIIGGGFINASLREKMIVESGIDKGGYMVILPMSSEVPLANIEKTKTAFEEIKDIEIYGYNILKGETISQSRVDSIRNAKLIFISGGDQSRFLDVIEGTSIKEAILEAFKKGSMIAGTSAGASVMSKIMVTGNQLNYTDNDGDFKTIEAGNVETIEGLGLLESVTIDQHFVIRSRLNRLISISIENPENLCVGIDESTAIFVEDKNATVCGIGQVIVIRNSSAKTKIQNGLLGSKNLKLDILLPGDSFHLN